MTDWYAAQHSPHSATADAWRKNAPLVEKAQRDVRSFHAAQARVERAQQGNYLFGSNVLLSAPREAQPHPSLASLIEPIARALGTDGRTLTRALTSLLGADEGRPMYTPAQGRASRSSTQVCACGKPAVYSWHGEHYCERHTPWYKEKDTRTR